MNSIKYIFLISITAVIIFTFVEVVRVYVLIKKGRVLAEKAVIYEQPLSLTEMKILVIGDSTAVGTGSANKNLTTAGRMGALYPTARIENKGINGLKLQGLLKTIDSLESDMRYSIILVQIGANDVVRFTSIKNIERDIEKVVARLSIMTDRLVILHAGDIGEAPIIPYVMKSLISKRSYEMREIYKRVAERHGAQYVELIDSRAGKELRENPEKYYASDSFHLNEEGYGLWFEEIEKTLIK